MHLLSSSPKLPRRPLLILPPLVLLAITCFCFYPPQILGSISTSRDARKVSASHHPSNFWRSFAPVLEATAPKCVPPIPFQNTTAFPTHCNRPNEAANITTEDVACLHRSHALFVDLINFGAPRLDFKKGTKGLATLATKSGFTVLLINLFMLRRTGSTLPLEVFLETEDDYEPNLCDVVLPGLNATCIILSSLLGASNSDFEMGGPLLWNFVLLFSSFESVLFLGAGSFLVHSPDELFDSEAFTKGGLVLWPSIENSSVSYQMSQVLGADNYTLAELPAIDHRQILISRKHCVKILSLAAYYSIYSSYYGPLINEHKILTLAAAVMSKPFYQVEQGPHQLGFQSATSASLQFDPTSDFNCGLICKPEAMFIHTNWLSSGSGLSTIMDTYERLWGTEEESRSLYLQDIEASAWGSVTSALCKREMVFFGWELCHKARIRLGYVFASSQMHDYGVNET